LIICRERFLASDYVTKLLNIPNMLSRVEAAMARKRLNPDKRQPPSNGRGWLAAYS